MTNRILVRKTESAEDGLQPHIAANTRLRLFSLHIFNPDTDYALASGRRYYTPPAHVVELRKRLALLPALYASPGDAILLLDSRTQEADSLRYHEIVRKKGISIIDVPFLREHPNALDDYLVAPWGWNASIRQLLLDSAISPERMPSDAQICRIRMLSHRRTTADFLREMPPSFTTGIELPVEIDNPEEAMIYWEDNPKRFFKAPWSSSGRGILLADDLERRHVEPWIRGIIRRQGSVMMEKAYDKSLDFATEWICTERDCRFLGFSIFEASRRGKYHFNRTGTQNELKEIIREKSNIDIEQLVEAQKRAIKEVIGEKYEGPLGIDMLCLPDGSVHPCIELNFRHTMGMIGLIN